MKRDKTLIQDLLTENRFWTFWSTNWKIKVSVFWAGEKTTWEEVKKIVGEKYFHSNTPSQIEFGYERTVSPPEKFDISFD